MQGLGNLAPEYGGDFMTPFVSLLYQLIANVRRSFNRIDCQSP
jgi:hypothetical protein